MSNDKIRMNHTGSQAIAMQKPIVASPTVNSGIQEACLLLAMMVMGKMQIIMKIMEHSNCAGNKLMFNVSATL